MLRATSALRFAWAGFDTYCLYTVIVIVIVDRVFYIADAPLPSRPRARRADRGPGCVIKCLGRGLSAGLYQRPSNVNDVFSKSRRNVGSCYFKPSSAS